MEANEIIAFRRARGITQEEAAKYIGVGRVTYIHREKYNSFREKEIEKLKELFNLQPEDLFNLKETNNAYILEQLALLHKKMDATIAKVDAILIKLLKQ